MKFEMKPLPYDYAALEPYISARTLRFHYDKHHKGYMSKLKAQIQGTPAEDQSLDSLVTGSSGGVFNAAAQVWNHDFYWQCLKAGGGGEPSGAIRTSIIETFGSFAILRERLKDAATGHFGSGWAWLTLAPGNELKVISTHDADNPLCSGMTPLLTIDVWEHAYYLDTQNDRGAYVDSVLDHLLNWEFAGQNFKAATATTKVARKTA
jgi:superoxide dismutase, Fe-Mn family